MCDETRGEYLCESTPCKCYCSVGKLAYKNLPTYSIRISPPATAACIFGIPRKHLTGATYLLGKLPGYFEKYPKAYSPECLNRKTGTIDVPDWLELAILEFGIANGDGMRIVLFLSYKPSRSCFNLEILWSSVPECSLSRKLKNLVDLDEMEGVRAIHAGSRQLLTFIEEDEVLGGAYTLGIIDIENYQGMLWEEG